MSAPDEVENYISHFPVDTQKLLRQMREIIKKVAPDAEEMISYAIPAFKVKGLPLIYFAGYKNHIGLYPVPRANEAFTEDLSSYKGGKGTAQFPLNKPLPKSLITRIVKHRLKDCLQKMEKNK